MKLRPALCRGLLGLGGGLLLGCGEPEPTSSPPRLAPSVVAVVQHYAGLMVRGTRLTTPASRSFADSVASLGPNNGFDIALSTCTVGSWVDSLQRLNDVYVTIPYQQQTPRSSLDLPNPDLLVRLGTLRRAFGPGTIEQDPGLTKLRSTRCYSVLFSYQPVPGHRVRVRACLPTANYADSVRVNSLSIYPGS